MTSHLLLSPDDVPAIASEVFRRVWRTALDRPGFELLRFAREVSSRELRRAMVDLVTAFPVRFVPERFGRFDQQVSSKFHRDGAPASSLLVLGYEPTRVRSRFWIADSSAAAVAAGLSLTDYLAVHNPMFPDGEAKLAPFVTELEVPLGAAVKPGFVGDRSRGPTGESFLVVLNNSLLPFDGRNPLGVLHKAVIPSPDLTGPRNGIEGSDRAGREQAGRRVINSIGFTVLCWEGRSPRLLGDGFSGYKAWSWTPTAPARIRSSPSTCTWCG
ncbi:MAG: hypothetical protein J0I06_04165 [Planctomycetes bacterium]|nr:hypothetical protein [Planctomycetota bacterium]